MLYKRWMYPLMAPIGLWSSIATNHISKLDVTSEE